MTRLLSSLASERSLAVCSPVSSLFYPGSSASLQTFLAAPFADIPDSHFLEALKRTCEEYQPLYNAVKGKLKAAVIPDEEDPTVENWFDTDMEEVRKIHEK